jgi:uncharacterized protein (DUF2384 family)
VNTGSGWATWNANADFVRFYIQDSVANGVVPVFTYYQLLQSSPGGAVNRMRCLPIALGTAGTRATQNIAQHILLRYSENMPVALAQKVRTLSVDFRSSARLADLLGVSRSQVTRWLRGAGIDPLNAEKVDLLELVWSNVLRIYDPDAALAWLFGVNPLLGDRRPVDLIRLGRTEELMRAIRAERSDTFA